MTDVYERLARKLDELPNGYPATESGVELKILEKIFTPEEAEMTLKIRPMPETVEAIAERLEKPVDKMQAILDNMVEKGEIGSFKMFGQQMYMLFPFIVGIYEFQLNRMDKEMTELFEEYVPTFMATMGGVGPAAARVVPVSTEIDQDLNVHRYEDMERMISEAKSFMEQDCICRKEKELEGKKCNYSRNKCLAFSAEENAFEKYGKGNIITKEEALKVMREAEEEGLVHNTYNVEEGQMFVCNCCPCCCGILRGVKEFNAPYLLAKSHFIATIDQETCVQCRVCADERCPMEAIVEEGDEYKIIAERCIGCGVCVPTCPSESIKLERKPESEHVQPPSNLIEWNAQKAAARGIEIRID
jgi:Pyruvate/2-oxoacid:ferredoxin oxidoreductase delta subunit